MGPIGVGGGGCRLSTGGGLSTPSLSPPPCSTSTATSLPPTAIAVFTPGATTATKYIVSQSTFNPLLFPGLNATWVRPVTFAEVRGHLNH